MEKSAGNLCTIPIKDQFGGLGLSMWYSFEHFATVFDSVVQFLKQTEIGFEA